MQVSRRQWLFGSVALPAWADIAAAQQHAHEAAGSPKARLEVLDAAAAGEIEALT